MTIELHQKTTKQHILRVAILATFTLCLIGSFQYALALNYPPYRTDVELHGINEYGQRSIVKVITPTLSTNNPQWWAQSYVVEMNVISDNTNGAVGAGYAYYKDLSGITQSKAVKYVWNNFAGTQNYEFSTIPSSTSYLTKGYYASYNSGSNCYNWTRWVTATDNNNSCIKFFSSGYPRAWSISSSSSNTFSSSTNEYSSNQFQGAIGGSPINWSSYPPSGQQYCWAVSPFNTNQASGGNTLDVIPPGTAGTGKCTNSIGSQSPNLPG